MSINGIVNPFNKNHFEFHLDDYDDKDVAYVCIYDDGHYNDMTTDEDKVMALLRIKYYDYGQFNRKQITKEMVEFYLTILDDYPKYIQNWITSLAETYLADDKNAFPNYTSHVDHDKRLNKKRLNVYVYETIINRYPNITPKELEEEYTPHPNHRKHNNIITDIWFRDYPHTIYMRSWYMWNVVEIDGICNDMDVADFSYLQFDHIRIHNSFNRCKNMKKLPYLNNVSSIVNSFNDCLALENVDFNIFNLNTIKQSFNNCPLLQNSFNNIVFQHDMIIYRSFNKSSNILNNCVFLSCKFDKDHRLFKKMRDIHEDTNIFRNCEFRGEITFAP